MDIDHSMDNTSSEDAHLDAPKVITLPPFLVLYALMGGIVLNWAIPLSFGYQFWGGLGFTLLIISFAGIFWAGHALKTSGTNISPKEPALTIVQTGPYRYSRNPIYLCFLVGFVGLSLMADAPMMLVLTLPLFYVLNTHVIVPEEYYLRDKFNDTYVIYRNKTRRWF